MQTYCLPVRRLVIDLEMFSSFMKNMWVDDSITMCHITDDDLGMYDVIITNDSVQNSSGSMPATTKGKLCTKVCLEMKAKKHAHYGL